MLQKSVRTSDLIFSSALSFQTHSLTHLGSVNDIGHISAAIVGFHVSLMSVVASASFSVSPMEDIPAAGVTPSLTFPALLAGHSGWVSFRLPEFMVKMF